MLGNELGKYLGENNRPAFPIIQSDQRVFKSCIADSIGEFL